MKIGGSLTLVLALCFNINLYSQNLYFDLGFNFSKVVESNNPVDEIFQRSAAFGLGFAKPISKRFGFSIDSQYSVKGYRIRGAYDSRFGYLAQGFTNFNYHYLDFIPAIHTKIYKGLNFFSGANLGYKIAETYNGEKTSFPLHKTLDFGLLSGLSYNFDRSFVRVFANRGLINPTKNLVITDINGHDLGQLSYKSINIQVTIGIIIFEFDNVLRTPS